MSIKINPLTFKGETFPNQQIFMQTPAKDTPNKQSSTNQSEKILTSLSLAGVVGLSIIAINQRANIKKLSQALTKTIEQSENKLQEHMEEKIIPYTIKKFEETTLYKSFQKSGQDFMDFLSQNHTPETIKEFLFSITADEKISKKFINEVTKNPRDSFKNVQILTKQIGGEKNLIDWLHAPKGYNESYSRHIAEIFENPETTLNDIVEISPNWHIFKLMDKTNNNITLGNLPKEFEELGDFKHFTQWLFNMQNIPEMLEFGGKYMKVTPLNAGLSYKRPFKIEFCTPEGKIISKPYVMKTEYIPQSSFDHINQAYHSDSNFLDAQIDYYLQKNKCENGIGFHYYDYSVNTSIYDFVEGEKYTGSTNIIDVNKAMKDLNRLGIFYNDSRSSGNLIVQNGILKIIDNGESYFHDVLKPPCEHFHMELPNWCGNRIENLTLNKLFGNE